MFVLYRFSKACISVILTVLISIRAHFRPRNILFISIQETTYKEHSDLKQQNTKIELVTLSAVVSNEVMIRLNT